MDENYDELILDIIIDELLDRDISYYNAKVTAIPMDWDIFEFNVTAEIVKK